MSCLKPTLAIAALSCVFLSAPWLGGENTRCAAVPSETQEVSRKVLIIGVDGLRPDQIDRCETPNLDRLIREGASTLNATNAWLPEKAWNGHSATNWGVLLTGVSPDEAQLTANDDADHLIADDSLSDAAVGKRLQSLDGAPVLTVFGYLKRNRPQTKTAVFNTWGGIGMEPGTVLQNCKSAVDYHLNPTGTGSSAERDIVTVRSAAELIAGTGGYAGEDVDCMFVHVSQCDAAGHAKTWNSDEYRQSVMQVDQLIGQLLRAIAARPAADDEQWLVMVSTDHGGEATGTGHADNSDPQIYTIPVIVWSPQVVPPSKLASASLYDIVPTALAWMTVESAEDFRGRVLGLPTR